MQSIDILQSKMNQLRLTGASKQIQSLIIEAETQDMSYLQFSSQLIECELIERNKKRVDTYYRKAHFPANKRLEDFDYRAQTSITKKQINQLLDFSFIDERQNLIFIGSPGVGKTHLSIGIGHKAVEAGYKVLFKTAVELVELLEFAMLKGEFKQKLTQISKYDLLIIDELGYLPMSKQSNHHLFQLINALYEYRSIILTTNKEFTQWNDFFLDENVAVPIVDRLIHHSKIFMLGGQSYRLRQKKAINQVNMDQN